MRAAPKVLVEVLLLHFHLRAANLAEEAEILLGIEHLPVVSIAPKMPIQLRDRLEAQLAETAVISRFLDGPSEKTAALSPRR